MRVLEETIPAEADCAMRRFRIVEADCEIQLTALHLSDQSIPGDEPCLQDTGPVANNHTLAIALIRLASELLHAPGQSLPIA